jgi:predicted AlkP superfamily phosphohydrolase/phosphomutase
MGRGRRVLVIGLDSVPPELLFHRFRAVMPNVSRLMSAGAWGTLKSCDPPITVPAWAVMMTGMDPGSLGVYGFRNRRIGSYFETGSPTPQALPYPSVWDILSRAGRRVCVIGMPPGYPAPAVNGIYVSDLLTPSGAKDSVFPSELASTLDLEGRGYRFDVEFRTDDRSKIARELFDMTRARWALARDLWQREAWDLFVLHEIGPDRLHHAFWSYFDPAHPRHVPDPEYAGIAERYYAELDVEIGKLLDVAGPDVAVLIVSDHGSQAMEGCFCINDWLQSKGYLALKAPPLKPGTALEEAAVDWSQTKAWGSGGYCARIWLNLASRESEGIVPASEAAALRDLLTGELEAIRLPGSGPSHVEVCLPEEVYSEVRGLAPDLLVYFGDLRWRSAGTVGHASHFLEENDTGPDGAVHSWDGVIIVAGAGLKAKGEISVSRIRDVAPTILSLEEVPRPRHMQGVPISAVVGR